MLVGAHVSTAGGLVQAHTRGIESDSDAIQIFNQSPRAWRPTNYSAEEIAEFRELMADGPVKEVVIHAVYLINCASNEDDVRSKSLTSVTHALRLGDAIGAAGVVLHPGTLKGKPLEEGLELCGEAFRQALGESDHCPLLLENTAGAKGTLGRSFEELAALVEHGGSAKRLGICLDSCHMLASGFDIRTPEGLEAVIDDFDRIAGLDRLQCLHVNDSKVPLGANRDLHADIPEGELGPKGIAAYLSEPRFEKLPALIETQGADAGKTQVRIGKRLREEGLAARGGRAGRKKPASSRAGRRKKG
jgi:deoxyribonuclease-4